jgi:hypothetical protein
MSSAISFYLTNLDANTAFVLDRSAFLDTVVDAVEREDHNEEAAKMITVLANNAFIPIVARLISNNDQTVRQKALLALGNLIASNNPHVREQAVAATIGILQSLEKAFEDDKDRHGAAYVCSNLARFMPRRNNAQVKDLLLNGLVDGVASDMSNASVSDLLHGLIALSAQKTIPTELLLDVLSNFSKKTVSPALNILGDQIAEEFMGDDIIAERFRAYEVLRTLLLTHPLRAADLVVFFWTLSNLVVESEMPDNFLQDIVMVEAVCEFSAHPTKLLGSKKHYDGVFNAVWVLVNAIVKSDLYMVPYTTLELIRETLESSAHALSADSGIQTSIKEVQAKLSLILDPLPIEEEDEEDNEDVNMEWTDDDVGGTTILPGFEQTEDFGFSKIKLEPLFPKGYIAPCEAPAPCERFYAPNAIDLINKTQTTSVSSYVNALIQKLVDNNLAVTPLDDCTILTVGDLKTLELRGFQVCRGHIMINPAVLTAVYSA